LSLNLLLGYAGLASVAPAAFGAIGGYTVAWVWVTHHLSLQLGILLALACALLIGLLVGLVCLKLDLLWLVLLTIALSSVVPDAAMSLQRPNLGQSTGLGGVTNLPFFGFHVTGPSTLLPLALGSLIVVFLLCMRIGESPYGRVLRAIRDDVGAAQGLGKNVFRFKLQAFGITSAMFGLAGVLVVLESSVASPDTFSFSASLAIFAIVVVGGMGNFWGSVLGAALVVLSTPFFQDILGINPVRASLWQQAAYGVAVVLVIWLRPQGLIPEGSHYLRSLLTVLGRQAKDAPEPQISAASAVAITAAPAVPAPPPTAGEMAARDGEPGGRGPIEADRRGPGGSTPVLTARGLKKHFAGIIAVNDVNIDLLEGKITALVGPNGAGKTTVFNLIAGALRPDAGSVLLKGQEVAGHRPDEIAKLGMVRSYQDVRLFPQMTALQNVAVAVPGQEGEKLSDLFGRPFSVRRQERRVIAAAEEWLAFVGMSAAASRRAVSLAFGEQKLVAMARVLATEAEVILLDEPTSGIEASWVDVMLELIRRVGDQGRTVCIVEHNMHVIEHIADITYFMESGRVAAHGDISELLQDKRLAEVYFGST
jgi:branched-chain amino acid transport system permease protein